MTGRDTRLEGISSTDPLRLSLFLGRVLALKALSSELYLWGRGVSNRRDEWQEGKRTHRWKDCGSWQSCHLLPVDAGKHLRD